MAEVLDKDWAGIDVGKTHIWVCAVDTDGRTLLYRKAGNDETEILHPADQ
ncbi:IS110 family transposase [Nocardia carnea]|nr:transposase [Nocardia carnea]